MQFNIAEAKDILPNLIFSVEHGEEVILTRNDIPVAKLIKYEVPKPGTPGAWKNKVRYSDIWDSPETNAEVAQLFLGSGDETSS